MNESKRVGVKPTGKKGKRDRGEVFAGKTSGSESKKNRVSKKRKGRKLSKGRSPTVSFTPEKGKETERDEKLK